MLRAALLLFFCYGLFAQNQTAHLDGRVINAVTGEPLRKADVLLHGGQAGDYSATTDAAGHFAMDQIAPGSYNLTAQHQNFSMQSYGAMRSGLPGTKLTLSSGQQLSSLEMKLIPFGVISGKVVDEDGDPVTAVTVTVMKWGFMRGGRQLTPAGGGSATNDRGEFRIYNLPAGHYYLMAVAVRRRTITTPHETPESYVSTFYPSAPDVSSATSIVLADGQEASGRDIQLRKTRMFSVEGKIAGAQTSDRFSLSIYPSDSNASLSMGMSRSAAIKKDERTFNIAGVAPGSYTLIAMLNNHLAARQDLVVGDADVQDVVVTLIEPGTVKGRVSFDPSATQPAKLEGLRVSLSPVGTIPMNSPNSATAGDGSFTMDQVSAERFKVNCSPIEGAYLKTVRWNGQDVNDGVVEMTGGGTATLDLQFAPTTAEIDGDVKIDDQPAPGASILLVPASGREYDFHYMMADQNGHFAAKGVAPGGYTALAVDTAMFGMPDAALLKALEKFSAFTTVDQSGTATIELKLIPEAAIEAAQ